MPAAVQVSERTLQLLKNIKEEMKASSYNQAIKALILENRGVPTSMFGSNPKLTPFTESDES